MIKRLVLIAIAAVVLVGAGTGCRTAHGFGEDMQNAGEKLQDKTNQ